MNMNIFDHRTLAYLFLTMFSFTQKPVSLIISLEEERTVIERMADLTHSLTTIILQMFRENKKLLSH